MRLHEVLSPITHDARGKPVDGDIVQRTYDTFTQLDKDKSGTIERDELAYAINSFTDKVNVTLSQCSDIIELASKHDNERKHLTFSEFFNVYSALNILSQLQSSDIHKLNTQDLKRALIESGINPSPRQLQRMFILADKYRTYDRTGKINFLEFLQVFTDTPLSSQQLFLHSWYTAGRNSTPFNRPANIDPVHDFVAGTCAGIALTIVGHPFDTIKVRLQTESTLFRNGYDCLKQTITNEGILALYKGMSGPMSTIPLVNALTFWAYGQAKDVLHKFQLEPQPLNILQISACGGFAGLLSCFVSCPVELIKTRLQIQYNNIPNDVQTKHVDVINNNISHKPNFASSYPYANVSLNTSSTTTARTFSSSAKSYTVFSTQSAIPITSGTHIHIGQLPCSATGELPYQPFAGPLDAIKRIYELRGFKGLYRGMSATIYREIPGFSIQFGCYEGLKRAFTPRNEKISDLSSIRLIAAGGTAGLAGWIVSYPADYIKSQIQAEPYNTISPWKKNAILFDGGFIDCGRSIIRKQGITALFRGFTTCAVRAFPANAAGFYAYEFALSALKDKTTV